MKNFDLIGMSKFILFFFSFLILSIFDIVMHKSIYHCRYVRSNNNTSRNIFSFVFERIEI